MKPSESGAIQKTLPAVLGESTGGDFLQVLQSTLDDAEKLDSLQDGELRAEEGAGAGARDTTGENVRSERKDNRANDHREEESDLDDAALAIVTLNINGARKDLGEAADPASGRLTSLDSEVAHSGSSQRGRDPGAGERLGADAEIVAGSRLSGEQAAIVAAALEVDSVSEGSDPRAALAGETISNLATLAEGAQETSGPSRVEAEDRAIQAHDASDLRGEEQRGSNAGFDRGGEERHGTEQALSDRATEGAQSEENAKALGQAIVTSEMARQAPDTVAIEGAGLVANPVAGTVMETTTTTTPGASAPAAAAEAISVQTEWLARNGGGTARILLSPPSLGEVAIHVSLRGGNVDVLMVVNEAAAQSVAEEQADRLSQAFSNHDLRMENFEVRRSNPQDLGNGDLGQFSESKTRDEESAGDSEATNRGAESGSPDVVADVEGTEQLGQPQNQAAGLEASVDLRI